MKGLLKVMDFILFSAILVLFILLIDKCSKFFIFIFFLIEIIFESNLLLF